MVCISFRQWLLLASIIVCGGEENLCNARGECTVGGRGDPMALLQVQLNHEVNSSQMISADRFKFLHAPSLAARPPYRGIELAHLLKAGGSAAFSIINRAAHCEDHDGVCLKHPEGYTYSRQKFHYKLRGASERLPYFRIQVMREPCSYYVSMWRFQGQQHTSEHPHKLAKACLSGNTSEADYFPISMRSDKSKLKVPEHSDAFSRWMRSVHAGASVGTISHRLWCTARKTYSAKIPPWDDGQLGECSRTLPSETISEIQEGLEDPEQLFANVHCWVDMANLSADLASCLRQFHTAHPGSIDLAFVEQLEAQPKHKATWACDSMFDTDLKQFVMKMDDPVFKRFGYSCCRPHGFHEAS